jgi:cardiolipin synthase A/B
MPSDSILTFQAIITVASLTLALFTSAHVVLYKRDVRAAIGWVGMIWLTPLIGSLLYISFGINRLQRRAKKILATKSRPTFDASSSHHSRTTIAASVANLDYLHSLVEYGDRISDRPLLSGNCVEPITHGDAAYTAILSAIEQAQHSVSLQTYIFDNDAAGQMFVAALAAAQQRGVQVRVLIDDVGIRYTWPTIRVALRKAAIPFATFLPTLIPWKFHYSNLRNHRKIIVVDGRIGFTGGMNIRAGHMPSLEPRHPIEDLHFRVEGPVALQLQEAFAFDWEFCTGECLTGETWFPEIPLIGNALARGISDGPDHDSDKIRLTMMGALACARKSVFIMTPYFLPDTGLIHALNTADLRGVDVQILLPSQNNLALVQWASTAQLWQVLKRGVQIWQTPPPFDHSKLMIVDDRWVLFGSANWDPRSLRLNFEFNVECYDAALASDLRDFVQRKIAAAKPITLADVDSRPLWMRLRDGFARLLSPYL